MKMDVLSYGLAADAMAAATNAKSSADSAASTASTAKSTADSAASTASGMDSRLTTVENNMAKATVTQVTKLGVVAPHTTQITIPETLDFSQKDIMVLKLQGVEGSGGTDVVKNVATFSNGSETDFIINNSDVQFIDGKMNFKKSIPIAATKTNNTTFLLFSVPLSSVTGKNIDNIGGV
jgi:hypothetical protein